MGLELELLTISINSFVLNTDYALCMILSGVLFSCIPSSNSSTMWSGETIPQQWYRNHGGCGGWHPPLSKHQALDSPREPTQLSTMGYGCYGTCEGSTISRCYSTPTFIVINNNSCHGVSLYSWVGSVI